MQKVKLKDFNNLAKTLSLNFYHFCYAEQTNVLEDFIRRRNSCYAAEPIKRMMREVADAIGAVVLNTSVQDYLPYGASAAVLVAEHPLDAAMHLDKSHLTVHTYPEICSEKHMASLRLDMEVSTCGCLLPCSVLEFLMERIRPDLAWVDYRVRGFTRDEQGAICLADGLPESARDLLSEKTAGLYEKKVIAAPELSYFHMKLKRKDNGMSAELLRELSLMFQ